MGATNDNQLPLRAFRAKAETVSQMATAGWSVIARCAACGLAIEVALEDLAKLHGRDHSLWNRRQRCVAVGCGGAMDYLGKPPGSRAHEFLRAPRPEPEPAASPPVSPPMPSAPAAAPSPRQAQMLERLGLTRRDWARIKALALTVTPNHQPAALSDLDGPWRVGAVCVEQRRHAGGRQIGTYQGRAILIWPK